jgi:guanylate kinase
VSGPSAAAGKGRVVRELIEMAGVPCWHSVSMTTRAMRSDDQPHHTYIFVSPEEFTSVEDAGGMLEANGTTEGNRYGTPLAPVLEHLAAGEVVIMEIDIYGGRAVHEIVPDALFVFIKPTHGDTDEDVAELRHRLEGRGTNDQASMERRLEQARRELAEVHEMGIYDAMIVNAKGKSQEAAAEILELMRRHWPHLHVSQD